MPRDAEVKGDVLPTSAARLWKILSNCVVVMVAVDAQRREHEEEVVGERQEQMRRDEKARAEDALRSLNTRSCSRAPPPLGHSRAQGLARIRPPSVSFSPSAVPAPRRRTRPAPPSVLADMSTYAANRASWGAGLLSPLSPTIIESIEARSRDVQERTFCKWCTSTKYRVLAGVSSPYRLNTKLEANGHPPMSSLVKDLSDGVRLIQLMVRRHPLLQKLC
ncbi:hypothetical protein TRAPUB_8739 [Trametes pubescens]|uniref:Uncharacterized protein n=1 Tax=Trametes pubescens TaxID=154538 RepID=A0A1M2W4F7_TRAPU|nr:hypothetical protein TRAPUB_8739 [Trametes pubescens]